MGNTDTKKCMQCGDEKPTTAFVSGRNRCKACRSANESNRQKAGKRVTLKTLPVPKKRAKLKSPNFSFSDRDALDDFVKQELQGSLEHLNELIEQNTQRLEAARQVTEGNNSKAIDEATKALQKAVEAKAQIITNLMERLKLLDDLRAKTEKAKPVSFTYVALSADKLPKIVKSRKLEDVE